MTYLTIALGLLFGGYWLAGNAAVGRGTAALAEQLRGQGWTLRYDAIETGMSPVRFDNVLTQMTLTDDTGWFSWAGPTLRLHALTTWPTRINLDLPGRQMLTIGGQQLTVTSEFLQAAVTALARPSLPLHEIALDGADLSVISDQDWQGGLETAKVLFVAVEPGRYHLEIEGFTLSLPDALTQQLDPENRLPATVDRIILDLDVDFDRPLDIYAAEGTGPRVRLLNLRSAQIFWGDTGVEVLGQLAIDAAGIPSGRITLIGLNWRALIGMAVNAGLVAPGVGQTWENMAETLAQDDSRIELPIDFVDGAMSFGMFPLGPAPRF